MIGVGVFFVLTQIWFGFRLLCFKFYSGLNLSCLAQSEPVIVSSERTFTREPRCEPAPPDAHKGKNKLHGLFSLDDPPTDKGRGKLHGLYSLESRPETPPSDTTKSRGKLKGLYSLENRSESPPPELMKTRNKLHGVFSLEKRSDSPHTDSNKGKRKLQGLLDRPETPPPDLGKAKLQGLYSLEPRRTEPRIVDGFKSLPLKLGENPKKPPKDSLKSSLPSIEKATETPAAPDYYPIWSKGDENGAPPLPPRVPHHRPLERSRAMPYSPEPPEVPRQFKPHTEPHVRTYS